LGDIDLANNYVWIADDMGKFAQFEAKAKAVGGKAREMRFREDRSRAPSADPVVARFDVAAGNCRERYVRTVGAAGLDEAEVLRWGAAICEETR
jgi:hypothetical protein